MKKLLFIFALLMCMSLSWAQNVAKIGTTEYPTLQAAVDDAYSATYAIPTDVTIEFIADFEEHVLVMQKANLNLTIDGKNHTLAGQIVVDGVGRRNNAETLTITNINFVLASDQLTGTYKNATAFVCMPNPKTSGEPWYYGNTGTSDHYNYAHNVTVSNCTMDATGAETTIIGVQSLSKTGPKNITLNNVSIKNARALAQLYTTNYITISNCTATENMYHGINIRDGGDDVIISGNKITVYDDYGIRVQAAGNKNIVLENDTVNAPNALVFANTEASTATITGGKFIGTTECLTPDNKTAINITGGTYSDDVDPECAPGYATFDNGDGTWTVAKAWFLYYNINGGASGTMDTIIVKQDDPDAQRTVEVEDCGFTGPPDHAFAIWNTKADSTGKSFNPGDLITLISDTTLYAIWKNGYTIYYNNNGGEGVIYQQSKDPGVAVTLDNGANFTKAGQAIYGWNTAADESGDNYGLGGTYNADVTVTMYAVWHDSLSVTNDSTDVVCHSENNGTDTVKISGGVIPFQLVLSSTALSKNDTVNITDRIYIYENLKPGSYTVKVSDSVYFVTGTFTIDEPDTLEITDLTVPTNNPCPLMGVGNFSASVTAQGGNDPGNYTYTWGDDATDVNAAATEVPAKADDIDYTYTVSVTVTDVKACTATATATIEVSKVIVHIDSLHGNTTMKIDTIKQGIMQGCDTIIRNYGTPTFTFSDPAITEDILDTVYNDIPTNYPDSIFSLGYNPIIWTAVDTCGHEVTCEQIIYIYHYPCPSVDDGEGNTYNGVRVGCLCWTDRNLVSTKYSSNGNTIPNLMTYVSENFPNESENVTNFGYLYDWYAAADTVTNSIADIEATYAAGKHVQGVCPNGWYLPTDEDFKTLESIDAKDLRSTDLWLEGGGTNATGFNAVPGGLYNCSTGRFEDAAGNAYYWSCHPVYDKASGAMIDYICEKIYNSKDYSRCNGFSVRCVLIYGE